MLCSSSGLKPQASSLRPHPSRLFARHLGDQIAIDRVEQTNTGERFDAAKRGVVDVDDPNTTVSVNEFLHGTAV